MPEIKWDRSFVRILAKFFKKHPELKPRFFERLQLLQDVPDDIKLKNHKLEGTLKGFHAFSINQEYRVVFFVDKQGAFVLFDIGDHDDVY